jgi:hypothetical protein
MASVLVRSLAAAAVGSLLFAAGASASTITVDTTNDTSTVSTCALRDAITAANTNTTPSGSNCTAGAAGNDDITITPTGTIQLASALPVIDTDMTITGTGSGSSTVRGELGTENYRIFVITTPSSGPFPTVTLTGMKVTNGAGGILDNTGGSLTLNDVTVSSNTVTSTDVAQSNVSGAGIANTAGAPVTINSSTVSGNTETATTTGPGFPIDSVFAIASGAAIQMSQGGALDISTSTISNNTGTAHGNQTATAQGAITNDGGPITITRSTISGNATTATVSEAAEAGSGIAAAYGGGILIAGGDSTLALDGSTVSGNTATGTATQGGSGSAFGGGMYLEETFASPLDGSATGSTIAGNAVSNAGGSGSGSLGGANVDLNTFATFGSTPFSSQNTIIAGGIGAANCGQEGDVPFTSLGYNIDTGTSCLGTPTTGDQTGVSSANLALGPLQNNGGPTETMAPGLGSFAVDQGTDSGIGAVTDQRGSVFHRTFDMNPVNADDGTDVGSVEQSVKATPANNDFGSLQWGTTSLTPQLFLMNNYTGNALPAGTVVGGANAGDFQTSTDGCTNTSIPNNTFCTLDVAFHPVSAGNGVRNASLAFSVSPVQLATLTGDVTEYISLVPKPKDFGSTQVGTPTGAVTFTVTNAGPGTSGTLAAALAGANASEFGITQNNCTGHTLANLGTCTVSVRFAPTSAGAKAAKLNITGTPGGTQSSALTGTATAPPPPPSPPPATTGPTGQRAAALKKCKKKKSKQARKKCKKKANRLPV